MRVINRINNNVVLVKEGTQQMIVTGRGLGFKIYPGNLVNEQLVEQRYVLQEQSDVEYYVKMLQNIPLEQLNVCEEIVHMASKALGKSLPDNLIFALADHVHFAISRTNEQMMIDHPLANEIKTFYPKEMAISRSALKQIKDQLGLALPDGEAVFIAMHIVNATGGLSDAYDAGELTEMMAEIVSLIETYFQCTLDPETTSFSRFITHLRYYLIRQLNFELDDSINEELLELVKEKYPDAYTCAKQITEDFQKRYDSKTMDSERLYLTLHINRLIQKK